MLRGNTMADPDQLLGQACLRIESVNLSWHGLTMRQVVLAARPGLRPARAKRWLDDLAVLQKVTPRHSSIQMKLTSLAQPPHLKIDASLRKEADTRL